MTPRCAAIDPSGESELPCAPPPGHPGRHTANRPGGGVWRWGEPAPQGPKRRVAPKRSLTLSHEAWAALGRLAGPGGSRSAVVERMAIEAENAAAEK